MADFPTSPLPSYPIEEGETTPEVLLSQFRDGSEQRRLKGPGKMRTFKLKFGGAMPITNTERLSLKTHYEGQNGNLSSFLWTHPDRGETMTVRYSAVPTFTNSGYNFYDATVELQEVPA